MKIYLLVMLMSALLMAIRFTTTREQQSNSSPSKVPLSQTSACAGSITKLHQGADHASQD